MGLSITSKGSVIELTGGCGMFVKIRNTVAKAFDKEFGKQYEKLILVASEEELKDFDEKINNILSDDRFKEEDKDIILFLFASDCGGKCGYKTCKKIYNLIKDIPANKVGKLQYVSYPSTKENDWEDFKQLLKDCYSHRSNLIWV